MCSSSQEILLSEDETNTVYIQLPDHPGRGTSGCVKEMLRLETVLTNYNLPMINLDFDENRNLIGLEIVV